MRTFFGTLILKSKQGYIAWSDEKTKNQSSKGSKSYMLFCPQKIFTDVELFIVG